MWRAFSVPSGTALNEDRWSLRAFEKLVEDNISVANSSSMIENKTDFSGEMKLCIPVLKDLNLLCLEKSHF
ncbi:Hypothetical predicted protein, partial [Marmota monax]